MKKNKVSITKKGYDLYYSDDEVEEQHSVIFDFIDSVPVVVKDYDEFLKKLRCYEILFDHEVSNINHSVVNEMFELGYLEFS